MTPPPCCRRCQVCPDSAFSHDGQLTKREVRAASLAKLVPLMGQHLWDVGAGSGSIGIEWMRAAPRATATAFEKSTARIEMIKKNKEVLGTPGLKIVEGEAFAHLKEAPPVPMRSLWAAMWATRICSRRFGLS